jgi:hypothetical protein
MLGYRWTKVRDMTVDCVDAHETYVDIYIFSVKYYPKGRATDCEASFLVFVPKRGHSTFALHQPIILHGAGLKLDSSGVVTCRSSTPTRVYTTISSEVELSFAIPDLDLHWFGATRSSRRPTYESLIGICLELGSFLSIILCDFLRISQAEH